MPSPFRFLSAGPPPPKVALLSDALFFTRAVPVTKGATPAQAASELELALEGISPFPLAQLYYGWFWVPGAEHALVFASYRRRFTAEQTAGWEAAELVLPAFAAVFGAEVEAATTIVLNSPEGMTAVHWTDPAVADRILYRSIALEATDDDRARVRDELLREIGGTRKVIDLESPLMPDSPASDGEIVFRGDDLVSRLAATAAAGPHAFARAGSPRRARRRPGAAEHPVHHLRRLGLAACGGLWLRLGEDTKL